MWLTLSQNARVTVIVAVTLVAYWGVQGAYGLLTHETLSLLKCVSLVTIMVGTCLVIFFNKAWRWAWHKFPFLSVLVFPDLTGFWRGHFFSTWVNPETGKNPDPIPVKFWIRQSLFQVSIQTLTRESPSQSTRFFIEADPSTQRFKIWYSYANTPDPSVRHRSAPHEGVAYLTSDPSTGKNQLVGNYYTDRLTSGRIEIQRISRNPDASGK